MDQVGSETLGRPRLLATSHRPAQYQKVVVARIGIVLSCTQGPVKVIRHNPRKEWISETLGSFINAARRGLQPTPFRRAVARQKLDFDRALVLHHVALDSHDAVCYNGVMMQCVMSMSDLWNVG